MTKEKIDVGAALIAMLETGGATGPDIFTDANIADVHLRMAHAMERISLALLPDATPSQDASGGTVVSLTEAIMGVTAGLFEIASAIRDTRE